MFLSLGFCMLIPIPYLPFCFFVWLTSDYPLGLITDNYFFSKPYLTHMWNRCFFCVFLGNCIFYPFGNGYYCKIHLFTKYILLSNIVPDARDTAVSKIVKIFILVEDVLVSGNRQNPQNIQKMDGGKRLVLVRKIK